MDIERTVSSEKGIIQQFKVTEKMKKWNQHRREDTSNSNRYKNEDAKSNINDMAGKVIPRNASFRKITNYEQKQRIKRLTESLFIIVLIIHNSSKFNSK